jgi:drug/metabolite transporter (DMT)-like permease
VIGGLLIGVLGAWLAGRPWDPQFEIGLLPSGFMALIFAGIAWAIIIYYAPAFADPASKEARDAVKIAKYEPWKQRVRLEFRHEEMAQGLSQLTLDS